MNGALINADTIVIEQSYINEPVPALKKIAGMLQEAVLPAKRSFGIIDLWSIRNRKRYFSIYRKLLY